MIEWGLQAGPCRPSRSVALAGPSWLSRRLFIAAAAAQQAAVRASGAARQQPTRATQQPRDNLGASRSWRRRPTGRIYRSRCPDRRHGPAAQGRPRDAQRASVQVAAGLLTDEAGAFDFPELPEGRYTLTRRRAVS